MEARGTAMHAAIGTGWFINGRACTHGGEDRETMASDEFSNTSGEITKAQVDLVRTKHCQVTMIGQLDRLCDDVLGGVVSVCNLEASKVAQRIEACVAAELFNKLLTLAVCIECDHLRKTKLRQKNRLAGIALVRGQILAHGIVKANSTIEWFTGAIRTRGKSKVGCESRCSQQNGIE